MALSAESAELVELFQWLTPEESFELANDEQGRTAIEDEVADIMIYLVRLADVLGVDVTDAVAAKLDRNDQRFPANRDL